MRCSICGAKLKKDGDICTNCYKEFQKEESLKKDNVEQIKLKRKYSVNYEMLRYLEVHVVFLLAVIVCFSAGGFVEALGVILIYAAVMGLLLCVDKRIAMGTRAVFCEKSAKYSFKFLFIDTTKVVKYSDIQDIRYFQTRRQKKFGYGDLCVYTKSSIPGAGFLNGFQIKNVENVDEVLQKITDIIGTIEG